MGINQLYAQKQHDLFLLRAMQHKIGYFNLKFGEGKRLELSLNLGARELKRDIGTRLFKYRGDLIER